MKTQILIVLLIMVLTNVCVIHADDMYFGVWNQVGNNWDEPDNWQSPDTNPPWVTGVKIPEPNDIAYVREDSVLVDTDVDRVQSLFMGEYSAEWLLDGTASLTVMEGGQLQIETKDSAFWTTGCLILGQASSVDTGGEPSGTLMMNGGRLDVDHQLILGINLDSEGLVVMNDGELYVGFNPQPDPNVPGLFVGGNGNGHIEVTGGTIYCSWLSLDGWDEISGPAGTAGGTIEFTREGGKIVIDYPDDPAGALALIEDYISNGYITNAVVQIVGDTVEITPDCISPEGDLNDDCTVDLKDFAILALDWQQSGL